MKSILVVDDMAVFREPIAATLKMAGYETSTACDGDEALRKTRTQRPDLILLDMAMPTMDGITFLKQLRADPHIAKTPVILLTAMNDKKFVLAAAPYGVKDYILKSRFGVKDLLERIKKLEGATVVAPATVQSKPSADSGGRSQPAGKMSTTDAGDLPRLLTREQFMKRVEGVLQGKTLSGVVSEVISMASSPRSDMAQLATLIARDTMLSARVLQIANSAAYAAGAKVTTIPDAIRKVGCSAVRNIAAALGVFDCLPDAGTDGFDPIRCWQHSFAVAQICERLAVEGSPDLSGLAYVVGLCHDVGDIFIRTQFGQEYQQVTEMAARTGRPRDQLHGVMLGMSPVQMISAILKCIKLPDAIREPIEILYSPGKSRTTNPIAGILWMAENYANADMLASGMNSEVAPLAQSFCRTVAGNPNPARPDPETLRAQVMCLVLTLGKLSRTDEAKLMAPIFKTSTANVWVARDSGISEFDPISLALGSMAKVSIHDRLPTEQDAQEIDGLVVVASSMTGAGFSQKEINGAVGKVASAGRTLAALQLTCETRRENQPAEGLSWRTSVALSDLAAFVEGVEKNNLSKAA